MQVAQKLSQILDRLVPEGDLDRKMHVVLAHEIRRRLAEFEAINRRFEQKYGMTLEAFEQGEVVKAKEYSFEVERDHQEWDAAVDAIETLRFDLRELER